MCSLLKTEKLHRSVVTWSVLVTRPAFFGIQKKSTSGLDRGWSGTLQRDSNNFPVTGMEVCSDVAEIRNKVSSQTVTMITGILRDSSSWTSDNTSPDDWETGTASVDWTAQTRMMWQKVQNVTFIRGSDTSSACVYVPSRIVRTDLSRKSHSALMHLTCRCL